MLLGSVYPHNYLSAKYLDAPFGKTGLTLREWIEADPAEHGELKRFTDILTEWTPPVANIPQIREQLFRAGRLYYYRFFREFDYDRVVLPGGEIVPRDDIWKKNIHLPHPHEYPPERFYRPDIHAPWEAPEPIPENFRTDYYKDKDPVLIY